MAQKRGKYLARWRTPDGKQHSKSFDTRKAAAAHEAKAKDAAQRGIVFGPAKGKARFRDVAAQWLESRHDLKETTRAAYAEALAATTPDTARRHKPLQDLRIDSVFGGYPLHAITRELISDWVARMMQAGKKPSTVRNAYFLVRQVLGQAVVDGRIDSNPADYVKLPTEHNTGTGGAVDDPSQFLTAAQVAALVDCTPWPYNVAVHLSAWSGIRAGELAGLQVGDVDLPAVHNRPGTVQVDRTVARVGSDLVYLTPKTKGSRRRVPLTPQTTALLRDYLAEHPHADDPTAPLFPAFKLKPPPPSTSATSAPPARVRADRQAHALAALNVTEAERRLVLDWYSPLRHLNLYKAVFRPAVLRANRVAVARIAVDFTWHSLRHTYASLCVAAGIPMFEVSRYMGHAKPSTTENVYAHLITDDHSESMAALGAMAAPSRAANNVVSLARK